MFKKFVYSLTEKTIILNTDVFTIKHTRDMFIIITINIINAQLYAF